MMTDYASMLLMEQLDLPYEVAVPSLAQAYEGQDDIFDLLACESTNTVQDDYSDAHNIDLVGDIFAENESSSGNFSGEFEADSFLFSDLLIPETTNVVEQTYVTPVCIPDAEPLIAPEVHVQPAPTSESKFFQADALRSLNLQISGIPLPRIAGMSNCDESSQLASRELSLDVSMTKKRPATSQSCSHITSNCWVCKSSTISEARKAALHRYQAKRRKRLSSITHRYLARSAVASSRSRQNGRFVEATQWVSLN
jgi:hypothetical protein